MGILNMEERMRLIGGKFRLQTSPGTGVNITASVPLQTNKAKDRKPGRRVT
jgi:signal transduction histidine kinase